MPGAGFSVVARCDGRGEGWARAPLLTGTHHLVSSLQGDKRKFSLAQETKCQRARGVKAAPYAGEGPDRPKEDVEAETCEEEETRGPESQARAEDASGPRGMGPASTSLGPARAPRVVFRTRPYLSLSLSSGDGPLWPRQASKNSLAAAAPSLPAPPCLRFVQPNMLPVLQQHAGSDPAAPSVLKVIPIPQPHTTSGVPTSHPLLSESVPLPPRRLDASVL